MHSITPYRPANLYGSSFMPPKVDDRSEHTQNFFRRSCSNKETQKTKLSESKKKFQNCSEFLRRWNPFCKRALDILFASSGLVLTLPFYPLIALVIKLESSGPVFYIQERIGHYDKKFQIIKFRSMKEGDEKPTKLGKILRKYSIDELPQFWNVLYGDMSIVGPRPRIETQSPRKNRNWWRSITGAKPGITGEAQCRIRSNGYHFSKEEIAKLDAEYAKNNNLLRDLSILFRTLWVICKGK